MMFALFMVVILLFTGLVWLLDILFLRRRRAAGSPEPVLVEYSKSFFPVILAVFMIRSFLVEPFKIPSGSMMPTLLVGDFILVNKYTYGLRVPILNNTFFEMSHPRRGEVMVFHYPKDPSLDYIKRVVGVPGDRIEYREKHLTINGRPLDVTADGDYSYVAPGLNQVVAKRYTETLGEHRHDILLVPDAPGIDGEVVVPEGHYFMMGDNRDNSNDSRYWGFVPERNIVGRAFMIWWSFDHFGRIGGTIQ
ncbi:signal peptidase I [mine drainage metagenome]|uniref:signal peptidase I n=1 Tax=mine drainage metagenome TaxID=410659 RepID=A0A1J5QTL5_9ZZZZ